MKKIQRLIISALCLGFLFTSCKKTMSTAGSTTGNDSTGSTGLGSGSTLPPGTVFTFAGGNQGFVNATGTAAQFGSPIALAVDYLGNVYVADALNYAIRKITSVGVVSTLAGNGTSGYVDGQGTNAEFEALSGLTVDLQGNVYVSEGNGLNNQRIRKITPSGAVSTLAGNGLKGLVNGMAADAEFDGPGALALDASGGLYVGDVVNQQIRKVVGSGPLASVSTYAGNGTEGYVNGSASSSEFDIPAGLAFDPIGNLYVADELNYCIRKINSAGKVSNFVGNKNNSGFADGTGAAAQFVNPLSIASDSIGNLYLTEGSLNNCIRKITPAGVVTTLTGTQAPGFADGTLTTAIFANPCAIAIGPKGNLFIADAWNYRIRKIILTN